MAEVAAGAGVALAVEQVLSTTAQAGVAGYFITKPTLPLNATFTRIAIANDDDLQRRSLTRSNHSLTVLNNKAYIFGGETKDGLASNDVHVVNLAPEKNEEPDYQLIPAISEADGGEVPKPRTNHAACAFGDRVAVYGGVDSSNESVDEASRIWLFDPSNKTWSAIRPAKDSESSTLEAFKTAKLFSHGDDLVLCTSNSTSPLWTFSTKTRTWSPLPSPPTPASPTNAALTNSHLYLITSTDPLSSQLHMLSLHPPTSDSSEQQSSHQEPQTQKWTIQY